MVQRTLHVAALAAAFVFALSFAGTAKAQSDGDVLADVIAADAATSMTALYNPATGNLTVTITGSSAASKLAAYSFTSAGKFLLSPALPRIIDTTFGFSSVTQTANTIGEASFISNIFAADGTYNLGNIVVPGTPQPKRSAASRSRRRRLWRSRSRSGSRSCTSCRARGAG